MPGQFISIAMPLGPRGEVRPYSIASHPVNGEPLEICLNLVAGGAGSNFLFETKAGDELSFTGPFGAFTLERQPPVETVFIAETTAIAPIRPMIGRALSSQGAPMRLHHAAAEEAGLLYRGEFEALAKQKPRFEFEPMVRRGADLAVLDEVLFATVKRRYVDADTHRARHFYICGVGKGVLKIRDLLRASGYERRAVQYEQW